MEVVGGQLPKLGLEAQKVWEEQLKMSQVGGLPLGWQLFMTVGVFQIQSLLWLCSCLRNTKKLPLMDHLLHVSCYPKCIAFLTSFNPQATILVSRF